MASLKYYHSRQTWPGNYRTHIFEQTGNTPEDAHAEAWAEIVGFIQDASKVGELDVLAITRKDS